MKKNLIILVLVFAITKLYGQGYYVIDFVGDGATVESISVENLTQGTSVEMDGTDVLHLLLEPVTVSNMEMESKKITIFPNPMEQTATIEFFNAKQGNVNIRFYSITGKQIFNYSNVLSKGWHTYSLSGVAAGSYVLSVKTETDYFTDKLISLTQIESLPVLNHKVGEKSSNTTENTELTLRNTFGNKVNKSLVEMDFDIGDELKFTGSADGFENSVIFDSPTSNQTYTFVFTELSECGEPFIDPRDDYTYQTVQIGDQCWMAENLAYLPEITYEDDWESYTEPQYAVYDYTPGSGTETVAGAKASEHYANYGVLYNWPAAMNGAESSEENPSGVQGICPPGWHLPSDAEWKELEMALGMSQAEADATGWRGTNEGSKLAGNAGLWTDGELKNDVDFGTSGFTALPGGNRSYNGSFLGIGDGGRWWSATEGSTSGAWRRTMLFNYSNVHRINSDKELGFSVRCLRD